MNNIHNTNHQTEQPDLQPVHNININLTNSINIIAPNKELIAFNTNSVKKPYLFTIETNVLIAIYKTDERVFRKIIIT